MQMEVTLKVGMKGLDRSLLHGPSRCHHSYAGLPAAGLLEACLPELRGCF